MVTLILEDERVITLSVRDTELFFTLLENPPIINDRLQVLLQNYKKSDLHDDGILELETEN